MALALRPPPPGRDPLVRMMIVNWVVGACMGVAFALVLLAADAGGVRSHIMGADSAGAALALLFGGFAIAFGAVIAAMAVMLPPGGDDDRDGGHGLRLRPELELIPVRVQARNSRRRR